MRQTLVALAAAVLIGLALPGCDGKKGGSSSGGGSSSQAAAGPNVLLVTVDSLRPDRLGSYGYDKAITPAMDDLARRGTRYTNAFTPSPLTLPACASILTGLLPPEHAIRDNAESRLANSIETLGELFKEKGYRTGAFVSTFLIEKRFGLDQGFDRYDDNMALPSGMGVADVFSLRASAKEVADRTIDWLKENGGAGFFCWVQFHDTTLPYMPPEPFNRKLDDPYDGEVAGVDAQLARIVAELDGLKLRDKTLIVVCGAYGESLGEHGENGHGYLLYDPTVRVPLILCWPGKVPAGQTDARPTSLVDVAPTVLSLVSIKKAEAMHGENLLGKADPDRVLYAETDQPYDRFAAAPQRLLIAGALRYVHSPQPELYDVSADPKESRNVAGDRPGPLAQLKGRLDRIIKDMAAGPVVPLGPLGVNMAQLRAANYPLVLADPATATQPDAPTACPDVKELDEVYAAAAKVDTLWQARRVRDAVDLLTPLAAKFPNCPELRQRLGAIYMAVGAFNDAAPHIQAVLRLRGESRSAVGNMAMILRDQRKFEDAIVFLRRAMAMAPDPGEPVGPDGKSRVDIFLKMNLGLTYMATNELDKAADQFNEVLKSDPANLQAMYQLANILTAAGRGEDAIKMYREIANKAPEDPGVKANYARALVQTGHVAEGIEQYRDALALAPNSVELRLDLAQAQLAYGMAESAVYNFQRTTVMAPDSPQTWLQYGRALSQVGQPKAAMEALRKSLSIQAMPETWFSIALVQTQTNDLDPAATSYREALKLRPGYRDAMNNLGDLLRRQKRYSEAVDVWRQGLAANPNDVVLTYNLAWTLATCPDARYRNGAQAVQTVEGLPDKLKEGNAQVLDARAAAYAENGQFPQALEFAKKARDIARDGKAEAMAQDIEKRIALYSNNQPYHETAP